jgi:asparagine synthetase B (glutamine-hydrolysing)
MYKNVSIIAKDRITIYQKGELSEKALKHSPKGSIMHVSNEETLIEQLYKTLRIGLENILPSTEKKAAVLLGGFDSALVASMLVNMGIEVETFSFYYEEEEFNQKHTDTLAKHLGIKHNWIKVDDKVFEKYLNQYSEVFNYPTNWPCYLMQTAYLCQVIRDKGFNYCYTGDGCDALFYGYPLTFKRAEIMSKIGTLPNPILTAANKAIERPVLERNLGRPHQVLVGALRSAKRKKSERTFLTFRIFNEMSLKQLRKNSSPKQEEDLEHTVSSLVKEHDGISPIRMAYEGKNKVAPSRNKINGSADLSGLVIMSPYTHQDVKAFVKKIPDHLLRPENSDTDIGKYILSKMAEKKKLLPHEVIYQPKMAAADAPLQDWYNSSLKDKIDKYLNDLPFSYNSKYILSLIRETRPEKIYAKIMSRETNKFITMDHCISLLLTYSRFTDIKK